MSTQLVFLFFWVMVVPWKRNLGKKFSGLLSDIPLIQKTNTSTYNCWSFPCSVCDGCFNFDFCEVIFLIVKQLQKKIYNFHLFCCCCFSVLFRAYLPMNPEPPPPLEDPPNATEKPTETHAEHFSSPQESTTSKFFGYQYFPFWKRCAYLLCGKVFIWISADSWLSSLLNFKTFFFIWNKFW